MNRPDGVYFLDFRHRVVILNCLHLWSFVAKNGQNFGLLFRREIELLRYRFNLCSSVLSRGRRCQQREGSDAQSRCDQSNMLIHIVSPYLVREIVVIASEEVKSNRISAPIHERGSEICLEPASNCFVKASTQAR